jgi:hypothetical protein
MNLRTTILTLATASFAAHGWADGTSDSGQKLRFAQITDVHLFDAGYNCYAPDVSIEQDAAINGLKWAVNQINQEYQVAALSFVVITGDLGIANLRNGTIPPQNVAMGDACSQNPSIPKEPGPVKPESIRQASINFAGILRELKVRSIYLVPGENDVQHDAQPGTKYPINRDPYKEFVQALSREMPGRIRDLSGIVEPASDTPWDLVQGYKLMGLDSTGFNPSDGKLTDSLPAVPEADRSASKGAAVPPCREPDPNSAMWQLSHTAILAARTSGPFLLFTHIPGLRDPDPGRQANDKTGHEEVCSFPSILCNPNLVGVFAGHFYSGDASQYGGPFFASSTESPSSVRKMYVAPPVSLKNQWGTSNPRRGLMIVDVKDAHVSNIKIDWYRGVDPTKYQKVPFASGAQTFPSFTTWLKYLLLYGVVALLLFLWDFASHAPWPKLRTTHSEIRSNLEPPT